MEIREHFGKVFHVNVWQNRETGDIEAEIYRADQGGSTSDSVRNNHVLIESFAFVYSERHLVEHLRK